MKKQIWLLSEHGDDARDNGYVLFKYICENHPEIAAIYVCDRRNKKDWDRVACCGRVIQKNSWLHKYYFKRADRIVTSHIGDSEPWPIAQYEKRENQKIVFLQHGVTNKNMSSVYGKWKRPADMVIATSRDESTWMQKTLGYNAEEIKIAGFPRFDLLNKRGKRVILLIPTWRSQLGYVSYSNRSKYQYGFMYSEYYKHYQSLITNEHLLELLDRYDMHLYFYPHYEMQPFLHLFQSNCRRIIMCDINKVSVHELLNETSIMITDFSSVVFDYGYVNKPIIHYHFDAKEVLTGILRDSYFSFEENGFGPIAFTEDEVIHNLEDYFTGTFDIDGKYRKRSESFFQYRDSNNCKRVFREIKGEE